MMPSEEEKTKIMEAQMSTPDIPLGTAEQFLLTLSSITELEARLKLWAFKLDYETVESVSVKRVSMYSLYFAVNANSVFKKQADFLTVVNG
jgi:hypothetical protein